MLEKTRTHKDSALSVFGANIRQIRTSKHWTLLEFERRSGYSRLYLSPLEIGRKDIQLSTAVKIAKALDVALPKLFSRNFTLEELRQTEQFLEDDFLSVFAENVKRTGKAAADIYIGEPEDYQTLNRILCHQTKDPRLSTLERIASCVEKRLEDLFRRNEGGSTVL